MKEWIYKDGSGEYVLTTDPEVANLAADAVEVTEGADCYVGYNRKLKNGWGDYWFGRIKDNKVNEIHDDWQSGFNNTVDELIERGQMVWQREKPQGKCADKLPMEEALEFAEELRNMGESGWSKEKHSHYKKDVSHLNVIDPYRIADLYDLHPCAEHIMKKSLCAGGRGHKDLLRDIQDIIDTAERWKEMIEEDNREV